MEREAYYVRRSQAEMRPNEVLSIILDGMDQAKTNLPHYAYGNNPVVSSLFQIQKYVSTNACIQKFGCRVLRISGTSTIPITYRT